MENLIIKIVFGIMILTVFMMFFKKTSDNYSTNNNVMTSQELPDLNPDDDIEVIDFN